MDLHLAHYLMAEYVKDRHVQADVRRTAHAARRTRGAPVQTVRSRTGRIVRRLVNPTA